MELFEKIYERERKKNAPLADRLRPEKLEEFVGQKHILGEGKFLSSAVREKKIPSLIFWGPPGSGKTTLARILAREVGATFLTFSAVLSGIKEIKEAIREAETARAKTGKQLILFIDEIHRFNKSQQDALLPFVEDGTVTLIGTTTENPSFEIRGALLSRCRVLTLEKLTPHDLEEIFHRALHHPEHGVARDGYSFTEDAKKHLIASSDGDARALINAVEASTFIAASRGTKEVTLQIAEEALRKKALLYDRAGEEHFNLISAFHKSLRGSDPDAALYWLVRMLKAGEDPLYVARRMIRFASEDVGNADPHALTVALSAHQAYTILGSPEGELALAQAALYLATAPKSNRAYTAFKEANRFVDETGYHPVPYHLRNAPTKLMEEMGYGEGYRYPHDYDKGFVLENYFPESLRRRKFYHPTDRGYEKKIKEYIRSLWGDGRSSNRRGPSGE
ncbi:MAG: replication-associated recombination protein A [Deltaproteobacteria bacterium]|nr:MAG: replication-associated recombination protein A [Deltaproteobacteria bacterium]